MPGKRISELTALSGAGSANNDDVVIFDATASETKRISRSQLAEGMQADVQVFSNKTIDSASNTLTVNYKEARVETSDASRAHLFTTVAALLADGGNYTIYAAGQIVEAGGFRYQVAASGASDQHVTTAGGVKLYVLMGGGAVLLQQCGGVVNGTTDDISAFEVARDVAAGAGGGKIILTGRVALSRGILIDEDAIAIEGPAAGYGAGGIGAEIIALAGFTGDFIVKFQKSAAIIRSPQMRNVSIDGGSTSTADGLVVDRGYDNQRFENISCTRIADGKLCFDFKASLGFVGQGLIAENLLGLHRNDTNTAPAIRLLRQQEYVLSNCKGWSASSTAGYLTNTGNPWLIESCNGGAIISPSAVSTSGVGFRMVAGDGGLKGLTVITPTIENVSTPISLESDAVQMFGTAMTVVAVGSEVRQPADGSTARGTVFLSTAIGIYAHSLTGTFGNAPIYTSTGTLLGTITSNRPQIPSNVRIIKPRIFGPLAGSPNVSTIYAGRDIDIDWDISGDVASVTTNFPLTINRGVEGRITVGATHTILNKSPYTCQVDRGGAAVVIRTSEVFTEFGVAALTLPFVSRAGRLVTIVHDAPEATAAEVEINCSAGTTVLRDATTYASVALSGNGSSVTLIGLSATQWQVMAHTGSLRFLGMGYETHTAGVVTALTALTTAKGVQHLGDRFTNAGRGASASIIYLPAVTSDYLGMEISATRVDAGTLQLDPNAADQIIGGTGVGKYIDLAAAGSVTLTAVAVGKWAITAEMGTTTWEP
jgi:hypothetical protein